MFTIEYHTVSHYKICRLLSPEGAYVDIIPELGAMVYQIALKNRGGSIVSLLAEDSHRELKENPWFRGRQLFPFNDRIPRGIYSFGGKEYRLTPNCDEDGSAMHGLIYNRPLEKVSAVFSDKEAKAVFKADFEEGSEKSYPFGISLTIEYTLNEQGFFIEYTLKNTGTRIAPAALGWHPYFTFGSNADNWKLTCGGEGYVPIDETMMPTGQIESVKGTDFDFRKGRPIGSGEIDIALTGAKEGLSFLEDGENTLELYFDPALFSYIQLFVPPNRDSIAIEPITAATNAFNVSKLGLLQLSGGESKTGQVSVKLR